MFGRDIWHLYEVSWLKRGKTGSVQPRVNVLRLIIDSNTGSIPESKSVKLYLNGLNNTFFPGKKQLLKTIESDIRRVIHIPGGKQYLQIKEIKEKDYFFRLRLAKGISLDSLRSSLNEKDFQGHLEDPVSIKTKNRKVDKEILYTHLFRSMCPITGQPDWARIKIVYSGEQIDRQSLFDFLLTFRNHGSYHEECCERIFFEIYKKANPKALQVFCNFTRRGGIDINPVRYFPESNKPAGQELKGAFFRQ